MLDFDVKARSRKCAKTGRAFEPGEEFYTVLVSEGSDVVRYDYAADAWEGPPEKSIGWWKSHVPDHSAHKMHWAPNDVMLHYFEQLGGNAEKEDVRFVLALLLVRRRVLRLEEEDDGGDGALVVYCAKKETTYRLAPVDPPPERIIAIQDELAELLFGKSEG